MAIAFRPEFKPIIFDKLKRLSRAIYVFFEYSPNFSVREVKCHTSTIWFSHHVTLHYTRIFLFENELRMSTRVPEKSKNSIMIEITIFFFR